MSTSQVLDRTFALYRQNFWTFAGITALPPALLLIGQLLILVVTKPPLLGNGPKDPTADIAKVAGAGLGYLLLLGLALIGYAFASGASVYAVSRVHLGHSATIAESYRLIKPYFGNILGIVIIAGICVGGVIVVGAVCLMIPFFVGIAGGGLRQGFSPGLLAGIFVGGLIFVASLVAAFFLSAKFSLAVPSCVLEQIGVTDSIKRSWKLTHDSVLRLILVFILAAAISWVVAAVLSIPYFVGIGLMVSKKDPSILMPFVIWQYVAEFLSRTLAGPLSTIAAALIYYDQRVRKEAFDLQLMMEAIGAQRPPQAAGAAPGLG